MTDKHIENLKIYNENLNKVVCESLQTALLIILKEKPFSNISITELCKKAGVSRMAFYNNYQTLDSLLESVVVEFNEVLFINKIGSPFRNFTGYAWYLNLFKSVKENYNFFATLFNAGFKDKYLSIITNLILRNGDISAPKKYLKIIWTGGIVNIIIYWLENNMKEDVEEIAKFCFENMSVNVD